MVKKTLFNEYFINRIAIFVIEKKAYVDTRLFIAKYEPQLRRKVQELFRIQEKEVLKNFQIYGESGLEFLVDVPKWTDIFRKETTPIIANTLQHSGQANLDMLLGKKAYLKVPDDISARADITFNMEYPEVVAYLATYPLKLSISLNETVEKELIKTLTKGIEEGESIAKLALRISNQFQEIEGYNSLRIARTETSRAVNAGSINAYKQSGVVESKKWLTANDGNVCPFCAQLSEDNDVIPLNNTFYPQDTILDIDGQKLPLTYNPIDYPPLHPNCRCVIIPIVYR
jgi:hypothetical protein